jgi:hypothetical protein
VRREIAHRAPDGSGHRRIRRALDTFVVGHASRCGSGMLTGTDMAPPRISLCRAHSRTRAGSGVFSLRRMHARPVRPVEFEHEFSALRVDSLHARRTSACRRKATRACRRHHCSGQVAAAVETVPRAPRINPFLPCPRCAHR